MELKSKRVAILAEDFHEVLEFWIPYYRMREAGADVKVVARADSHLSADALPGRYCAARADLPPSEAHATDFDAVIVPGGYAPDYLRADADIVRFVRDMEKAGKLVAAVSYGAWVPITADCVRGRTMTSARSIRTDVNNAGATYVDEAVVRDRNLITSRGPADLPAFCREIVSMLSAQ